MKTLRLTAMLCIALLTAMLAGCEWSPGMPSKEEFYEETTPTAYAENYNGFPIYDVQAYRLSHYYWRETENREGHYHVILSSGIHQIHGNACRRWNARWKPLSDDEARRIIDHWASIVALPQSKRDWSGLQWEGIPIRVFCGRRGCANPDRWGKR